MKDVLKKAVAVVLLAGSVAFGAPAPKKATAPKTAVVQKVQKKHHKHHRHHRWHRRHHRKHHKVAVKKASAPKKAPATTKTPVTKKK